MKNATTPLTRRQLIGSVLALGAGLSGCGGGGGDSSPCGRAHAPTTRGRQEEFPPVIGGAYNLVAVGNFGQFFLPLQGIREPSPGVLNSWGQVVYYRGYESSPGCGATLLAEPRLWTPAADRKSAATRSLEPDGSAKSMMPFCINDSGQTASTAFGTANFNVFLLDAPPAGGRPVARAELNLFPPPADTTLNEPSPGYLPTAVNKRGEMLIVSNNRVTYIMRGTGEYEKLTPPSPDLRPVGRSMDDAGVVVGYRERGQPDGFNGFTDWKVESSFLYQGAVFTELGAPAGYKEVKAVHRNAAGQVIGTVVSDDGSSHRGFLWQNGTFTLIGPEDFAPRAINAAGVVVGCRGALGAGTKAVVWDGGTLTPLGALIKPESGWELTDAFAINDSGFIAVRGLYTSAFGVVGSDAVLMPA